MRFSSWFSIKFSWNRIDRYDFYLVKSGPEIKNLVRKMSAPITFYSAWTPQKAGLHYIGRNAPDARARKNFLKQWARAHSEKYLLTFAERAGGPPAPWGGGPCARARARAKYPGLSNSHFLLYNFQNNQGKSCSAPRVWQLCKSSARSEPISQSYDQNKFMNEI